MTRARLALRPSKLARLLRRQPRDAELEFYCEFTGEWFAAVKVKTISRQDGVSTVVMLRKR